jgi:hypothetical protein
MNTSTTGPWMINTKKRRNKRRNKRGNKRRNMRAINRCDVLMKFTGRCGDR